MNFAIDTNIIVYLVDGAPELAARASKQLEDIASAGGRLVISAPVYAELLALPSWTKADLDAFIIEAKIGVDWSLSEEIWTKAGLTFAAYSRRRASQKLPGARRLLADFVIGAHAARIGAILTADARFYRTNFTDLTVLSP